MGMLGDTANGSLLEPLKFIDFGLLLRRVWGVVRDLGGVQEEAPTFGLRILITRETTERPEVIEAGFGTLVGSDYQAIVAGVRRLTAGDHPRLLPARTPFGRGNATQRIAECLVTPICHDRLPLARAA